MNQKRNNMGIWKRSLLYITRKRSKSALLFLLLFVMVCLVLTGISIRMATDDAATELRRTLGGYFKIESNSEYEGEKAPVTDSLINTVNQIDGIKSTNKMTVLYLGVPDLTLEPGRFTVEGDPKAKLARLLGNSDSSLHEYFLLRFFELTDGQSIEPKDTGKAMISEYLADTNNLTIGDSITAGILPEEAQPQNGMASNQYSFEIVGIFEPNMKQNTDTMTAECDMVNNFIFIDQTTAMRIQTDMNPESAQKYRTASFFVDDPRDLSSIIDQVLQLDGVDWNAYKLAVNNQAYETSVEPLQKLGVYVDVLVIAIIVICIILLSLVLTMWIRDRLHEIGIFLSIGIRKISIIGQHILEVFVVLALALLISWPVSNLIANQIGNSILQSIPVQERQVESQQYDLFYDPVDTSNAKSANEIKVSVGTTEFLLVAFLGGVIGLISVGVSSITIFRMKPKDILSSMD